MGLNSSGRLSSSGYFTAEILKLSQQPLILPMQLFTAGLVGAPMAIRRCPRLPCAAIRFRTHPPYRKRFGEICPGKSTGYSDSASVAVGCGQAAVSKGIPRCWASRATSDGHWEGLAGSRGTKEGHE